MTDFKKILIEKKSSDKFRDDYYRSIQDFQQSQMQLQSKQIEKKQMQIQMPEKKVRGNSYNLFKDQEVVQTQGLDNQLMNRLTKYNQPNTLIRQQSFNKEQDQKSKMELGQNENKKGLILTEMKNDYSKLYEKYDKNKKVEEPVQQEQPESKEDLELIRQKQKQRRLQLCKKNEEQPITDLKNFLTFNVVENQQQENAAKQLSNLQKQEQLLQMNFKQNNQQYEYEQFEQQNQVQSNDQQYQQQQNYQQQQQDQQNYQQQQDQQVKLKRNDSKNQIMSKLDEYRQFRQQKKESNGADELQLKIDQIKGIQESKKKEQTEPENKYLFSFGIEQKEQIKSNDQVQDPLSILSGLKDAYKLNKIKQDEDNLQQTTQIVNNNELKTTQKPNVSDLRNSIQNFRNQQKMKQEVQDDKLGIIEQKLQDKQKPIESKTPSLSQYEEPKLDKKKLFDDIFQGFQNKIEQKPQKEIFQNKIEQKPQKELFQNSNDKYIVKIQNLFQRKIEQERIQCFKHMMKDIVIQYQKLELIKDILSHQFIKRKAQIFAQIKSCNKSRLQLKNNNAFKSVQQFNNLQYQKVSSSRNAPSQQPSQRKESFDTPSQNVANFSQQQIKNDEIQDSKTMVKQYLNENKSQKTYQRNNIDLLSDTIEQISIKKRNLQSIKEANQDRNKPLLSKCLMKRYEKSKRYDN